MARPPLIRPGQRRAIALSEWLYRLFLRAYPATFRRTYAARMAQVFRDSCRDTVQRQGTTGLIPLWFHMLSDLTINVCLERWHVLKEKATSMATYRNTQNLPLRLWIALTATIVAFIVSLLASLNLYMLEDASKLTQAAYSASPLLRFSYDGIYLSALVAGVSICAIVGYAIVQRHIFVVIGLSVVALFVAFGGFGGLLVRHFTTFLILFAIFIALTLGSFLLGRAVAKRLGRSLAQRPAAILGACVSTGSVLLINIVALILHTLILNPVSHELYMQGQIAGTHLNSSLIAMVIALLVMSACAISLGLALRQPARQS